MEVLVNNTKAKVWRFYQINSITKIFCTLLTKDNIKKNLNDISTQTKSYKL